MRDRASFQFGDFVLVPRERLLLRENEPVPLTGKAFDLLLVLVRRSGQLVSKDELLQEVWPGRFVEEVNLSVNVSAMRKALGPNGAAFIQTVSKRGYRFVAPVLVSDSAPWQHLRAASGHLHGPRPRELPGWRLGLARHAR
jgi:DNA-binding winged helix-turn-helix (wHTH) protein